MANDGLDRRTHTNLQTGDSIVDHMSSQLSSAGGVPLQAGRHDGILAAGDGPSAVLSDVNVSGRSARGVRSAQRTKITHRNRILAQRDMIVLLLIE